MQDYAAECTNDVEEKIYDRGVRISLFHNEMGWRGCASLGGRGFAGFERVPTREEALLRTWEKLGELMSPEIEQVRKEITQLVAMIDELPDPKSKLIGRISNAIYPASVIRDALVNGTEYPVRYPGCGGDWVALKPELEAVIIAPLTSNWLRNSLLDGMKHPSTYMEEAQRLISLLVLHEAPVDQAALER